VTLDDVLREVEARVPYLRASTTWSNDDDWLRCDAIVENEHTLTDVVRAAMQGLATDDLAVAASLFTQAYAFRAAGAALAAYALDLPVPDVALDATAVRVDKPRPTAVAYLRPTLEYREPEALAHDLVGGHLAPFVDVVHCRFRVGERLLWGNVASSCAAALRAVEGAVSTKTDVRERAHLFITASADWFAGLGTFTVVQSEGREGWYWDRTNCCLWYQTAGARVCDNCSLLSDAERHRRRLDELTGAQR
jgi:ferric iron reductase protein FhuF